MKTTLVDELLKQSGIFRENEHVDERAMDSNDLEKRTVLRFLLKNTAIDYKGTRINILTHLAMPISVGKLNVL